MRDIFNGVSSAEPCMEVCQSSDAQRTIGPKSSCMFDTNWLLKLLQAQRLTIMDLHISTNNALQVSVSAFVQPVLCDRS